MIGATGAVGSALVRGMLASPRWGRVAIVTRRPTDRFAGHPGADKLAQHVTAMDRLADDGVGPATGCDAAFCTMGIGQPRKLSRQEFWTVDVDYAVAFARACRAAGVRHMSLLTSVGANLGSSSYYLRGKGTVEDRYRALDFKRLSCFRPSLLATETIRYGLQDRVTQLVFPRVSWMLPARFHEIHVEDLARAMRLNAEDDGPGPVEVLHYPEFQALLRRGERF